MHLVYAIDHLGGAGAQRQAVELAVHLSRRPDLRVTVLVYYDLDFFADRLRGAGVPVVRVPRRGRIDPSLPFRMARWLEGAGADVVHAFMVAPMVWTGLAVGRVPRDRRPLFLGGERNGRVAATLWDRLVESYAYRRCDAVTVNSHPMLTAVPERLGVPRERVHHLPNGIDLEEWERLRDRPSPLELEPGLFHVGLLGRLEHQKGHALLLDALARMGSDALARWRVWLVGARTGGSAFASNLEQACYARGLGDVVRFVRPVREVAALMARLDALVLPSRWEGFPNVLLEAMASGLPSVASRVGEVPRMIEDGKSGILVPPGDPDALAAALQRLGELPEEERRRMGARARATVEERYRIEDVAGAYLHLYESLLRQRGEVRHVA